MISSLSVSSINRRMGPTIVALVIGLTADGIHAYQWMDGFKLASEPKVWWNLTASKYAQHFHPSNQHHHVWLVGVERERTNGALTGLAYFNNSFGQPSAYWYPWGHTYRNLLDKPQLYAKLTGGLMYGYREPYEKKVPLNFNGFSPAIVPAVGWEFAGGQQMQINVLGASAIMVQFSLPLPVGD
jgi:hypothetical protein